MSKPKKNKNIPKQKVQTPAKEPEKQKTIYRFLCNVFIGFLLVVGCIWYTDSKGYFNPDDTNDHTVKKWNAYYEFAQQNDIDIVLVGNSHLYTGLNPKNLSTALGVNAFVLAAPGTRISDSYFCLKEAVTVKKPKIVIVETYGIVINEMEDKSDDLRSFKARKNIIQKLYSTPALFNSDYYMAAWSNTIKNHNYIFTDWEQIQRNIELNENPPPVEKKLYLGRYVRFTSGLEADSLAKYDEPDFIACDASNFTLHEESEKYTKKIIELCRENDIKLIFLTLPSYHKHIHNYTHQKKQLEEYLTTPHSSWLDLQYPYDYEAFTPDAFENILSENQHMTYYGSIVAAYKLAHYIHKQYPGVLPNRSSDRNWIKLFYTEEGFFENHPVMNDGVNKTLLKDTIMPGGLKIKEAEIIKKDESQQLFVKINKSDFPDPSKRIIRVRTEVSENGKSFNAYIDAVRGYDYDPINHYLFRVSLRNDIDVTKIYGVDIVN